MPIIPLIYRFVFRKRRIAGMRSGGRNGHTLCGASITMSNSLISQPMFALVDVNNFYVSCERAFNPNLINQPVVVLSNNDGCSVAHSHEVRVLGVKIGTPWFKLKDLARQHHIIALSSNYTLYADMSDRVMSILRGSIPMLKSIPLTSVSLVCRVWTNFG